MKLAAQMSMSSLSTSLITATLITGLSVYFVLSYLLIPIKFTLPICTTMALLSFGLTRYYSVQYHKNMDTQPKTDDSIEIFRVSSLEDKRNIENQNSKITFVFIYLISLVICAFFSMPRLEVYTTWNLLDITNIIELSAGIILGFFMPGYAVVTLIIKEYRINSLLKVLLGYLCSILITALTVYLSAILSDSNIYQSKFLLISVYLAILVVFIAYHRSYRNIFSTDNNTYNAFYHFISNTANTFQAILRVKLSEIIIFGSLFCLLILSTYYLYGGITIGDQWYHQGRAIHFIYGNFKELIMTNGDETYTPLLSTLLAGATSLTGVPLVNTYASIAFLNMMAVFAFYCFCFAWFPSDKKRAAIFASSLFVIASGFGWIYMLYLADTNPTDSQVSSISNFVEDKIRVTDIRLSANFMIAAFPDFSTGLILVSLPAGFTLLALVYLEFGSKISYVTILSLISILGILFHDEFYIFILVASLLPLAFNLKKKSCVYIAFLIGFAFVYIIDGLLPVKYFTSNTIFGTSSLFQLSLIFTLVTFSLYMLRQNIFRLYYPTISIPSFQFRKKLATRYFIRISFTPKVLLVSVVFYLFALSIIIWSQIPANYVDVHTQNYNTPWYLYSMRLGIIGLIGVAFILSYLFKRFEKQVFIFGIIIVVALLAGPYYNEHRFNKYVMAGMIGFASLMILKLVNFTANKKPVLNGVIIGSIVITAGLSTLMYIGYNALVVQTQDYTDALGRRNFPSPDEMSALDLMRSKIQDDSSYYNIVTFPNQYNIRNGDIISKLNAFSGLQLNKAIQTRYMLNASTLDSFYHLAESGNVGYIMIPAASTNQSALTDPIRFALENFQQIDKNDAYLILGVPSLHGPSTAEKKVGIIYKKDQSLLSTVFDKKTLQVNNYTFNFEKDASKFIHVQKDNQSEKFALYGYKKNGGKTFWSMDLKNQSSNYIELKFRILDETKPGKGTSGLKWSDGNKIYFVSLSDKGLQLREQMINHGDDTTLLLAQNSQVKNEPGTWYILQVQSLNNSINVYVDNILKIKVPTNLAEENGSNGFGISKVGINSENNVVEFEAVQLGKIESSQQAYDVKNKYEYYYPLTSLALSKIEYGSYADDDHSVFSNKEIILPFDRQDIDNETFSQYLNFTKLGGTIVVINSDDNFNGRFSKLFSIEANLNNTEEFAHITRDDNQGIILNVSGTFKGIKVKPSAELNIIASYKNKDDIAIAPFAIEKHMSNDGRIIYINGRGYFDAILNNPKKYFLSLANLSNLFELEPDESIVKKNVTEPIKRFIGDVRMSGMISINSSSFSMANGLPGSANVSVKNISISDRHGNSKNFENLSIIDIKAFGEYESIINSTGTISLPSMQSHHDYVGISLPDEFNMTIRLLDNKNSYAEIITNNGTASKHTIRVDNESSIDFYGVESKSPILKLVTVLKSPEITVNGDKRFDKTNFYGQEKDDNFPLNISGQVKVKFDYLDDFKEPFRNGSKIQYLSYIGSFTFDGKRNQLKQDLEVPGTISSDVKKRGLDVPLISILSTPINYIIITAMSAATITAVWLLRRMRTAQ